MIGAAIGLVFGIGQFFLLLAGVKAATGQQPKILPLVLQFLLPIAGLLLCAFLKKEQLLVCAGCMAGVLILGALGNLAVQKIKKNK